GSTLTSMGSNPSPANITAVYVSSVAVNYTTIGGAQGYELDASSTNFNGTGVILSSVTTLGSVSSLIVQNLNPDTTYSLKIGSLFNVGTNYSLATPVSTSTLTNLLSPSVLGVSSITVQAGWPAFAVGSGTNTTQGYRFEAYTGSSYTSLAGSSVTTL